MYASRWTYGFAFQKKSRFSSSLVDVLSGSVEDMIVHALYALLGDGSLGVFLLYLGLSLQLTLICHI